MIRNLAHQPGRHSRPQPHKASWHRKPFNPAAAKGDQQNLFFCSEGQREETRFLDHICYKKREVLQFVFLVQLLPLFMVSRVFSTAPRSHATREEEKWPIRTYLFFSIKHRQKQPGNLPSHSQKQKNEHQINQKNMEKKLATNPRQWAWQAT